MNRGMLEKGGRALVRLVNDLIWDNQVARLEFLAQRSDRAGREDVGAAELLEREDVRARRHLAGVDEMPRPVS
jgi:hypothetical protein